MAGESERVHAYMDTVGRMEPEIAMVDRDTALASIAISLRRIADALSARADADAIMADKIHDAIYNALVNADRQRAR